MDKINYDFYWQIVINWAQDMPRVMKKLSVNEMNTLTERLVSITNNAILGVEKVKPTAADSMFIDAVRSADESGSGEFKLSDIQATELLAKYRMSILREAFPQGDDNQKPDFGICDHCGEHLEQKDIDRYGVSWCHTIPVDDGHGDPEPAPCGPVTPYYLRPAPTAEKALRESLAKAEPRLARDLRHLRSCNSPEALQATQELADIRALLANETEVKDA